jgi:hypothetical protein
MLSDRFTVSDRKSYSKFFSEFIDTAINLGLSVLKKGKGNTQKGQLVTEKDMSKYQKMFKAYSAIYPIFWVMSKLDTLLFWRSGYMLIVKARINKQPAVTHKPQNTSSLVGLN